MKMRPVLVFAFLLLAFSMLLLATRDALGQPPGQFGQPPPPRPGDPEAGAAACATCCGGTVLMIVVPIVAFFVILAINIGTLFWVAKDAKSRGLDGSMWIFLILFTGLLGLAIYLFSRPQGMLIQCDNCGNNRMEVAAKCPHCGIRTGIDDGRNSKRGRRRRDDDDEDDE